MILILGILAGGYILSGTAAKDIQKATKHISEWINK